MTTADISVEIDKTILNYSGYATLLSLTDTPSSYSGEANSYLRVNSSADGIEFTDSAATIVWGEIEGTLSDQTDLQLELDTKQDSLTASTGINLTGSTLTTNDSEIDHDALSNFVENEHINHTGVTLTAGTGLTGGGDISSNRTFNVDTGISDNKIIQIDSNNVEDNDYAKFTSNGLEGMSYSEVKTDLGLVIGTNIQEWDSNLDTLAGLNPDSSLIIGDGLGDWETITPNNFITNNSLITTTNTKTLTNKTINASSNTITNITTESFKNSKVYLDETSDTYLWYNSGTGEVELYVGGNIRASW